ncbi:AAA family ATPase [Arcticibacter tournemirensis]|uniref:ATP-binding protein n=1 Tax=Arcticibacter tournemirensis TaxID=699437 RepID=A0A4V1KIF7_9SPHI|nr:AAA family ATPase [Arcticibacter tournemirensis]RXF70532.1 ATP-binding protein [Arcticibacter tournemirensis]
MKIKSVSVDHHKILGSIKINFSGDSEILQDHFLNRNHADIVIDMEETSGENTYTYIIGDNGIGKTVFFRTVIHYINRNDEYQEPKLHEFINLYEKNRKYVRIASMDLGYNELVNLQIYNQFFFPLLRDEKNFLKYYDSQLIFISSSFDGAIIHKNPRFRSFNYLSEINETKILFLRALLKYQGSEKLRYLGSLLGKKKIEWRLRCGLAYEAVGEIKKNVHTVLLKTKNGVNIFNFLRLIGNIRVDNGKIDTRNLSETDINVFEQIYNSGPCFKMYFGSELTLDAFFSGLKESKIVKKIEAFLSTLTDLTNSEYKINMVINGEGLNGEANENVKINDSQKAEWDFLISEISNLSAYDIDFLSLLQALGLIHIDIEGNGESVGSMSSGQKNLIRLFSFFADLPLPEYPKNCIVFIDEPENSLHPKWQQEYPANFKDIVERVYGITDSHFIFATHSPVLIMKSSQIEESTVLRFFRETNGNFGCQEIKNVSSYSIEEVLLDEFKISYRDQAVENEVKKVLDSRISGKLRGSDPIHTVNNSFELRDKINDLYNSINSKQ